MSEHTSTIAGWRDREKRRPDQADPSPPCSRGELEHAYLEVTRIRAISRDLSSQEKQLRKDLRVFIKAVDRKLAKRHDAAAVNDARRARQMLNRLDGMTVAPGSRTAVDSDLLQAWNETQDHGKPKARSGPLHSIRSVVSGGAPGLGKGR
jgi:hypothetical protein